MSALYVNAFVPSVTGAINRFGFEEEADAELNIDDYGLDECIRHYAGPTTHHLLYLANLTPGAPDPVYPSLKLVHRRRTVQRNGPWTHISQSYKGIIGRPPPAQVANSIVERQISISPSATTGASITVTYRTIETSWKYATQRRSEYPRYEGRINRVHGFPKITDIEGDLGTLGGNIILATEIIQTTFDQQEDGGGFQVQEANEIQLFDRGHRPANFSIALAV